MKVLGRATSSNVQTVMWLSAELGLPCKRLDFGGEFGGTDTPEYLAMNPMGRVPVLVDGDVTLFESQAILRYLARKYAQEYGFGHLWPHSTDTQAVVDQWMEWAKVNVYSTFTQKVFWQMIRTSAADRNHALVAEGARELRYLMTIAERQIERHGWLAGSEMTLADISFGTHLYRYFEVAFARADLPALDDYYTKLTARPAYAEHAMVSFEPLRAEGA